MCAIDESEYKSSSLDIVCSLLVMRDVFQDLMLARSDDELCSARIYQYSIVIYEAGKTLNCMTVHPSGVA